MNNINQYYEILGLKPGVSLEEVKQAYRDLAVKAYKYRGIAYSKLEYNQRAVEDLEKVADLYLRQGKIDSYQDVLEALKKCNHLNKLLKKVRNRNITKFLVYFLANFIIDCLKQILPRCEILL